MSSMFFSVGFTMLFCARSAIWYYSAPKLLGGSLNRPGVIHQKDRMFYDICLSHIVVSAAEHIHICHEQPTYLSKLLVSLAYMSAPTVDECAKGGCHCCVAVFTH